jgi:ferredoxin-NADP reductase
MSISPTTIGRPLPALRGRALPDRPTRAAPQANATLLQHIDFTESLADFHLQLDAPLAPFLPGQYVSVGVIDGADVVQRPYSVVSLDSSRRRIELFVRRIPGGNLSSRFWDLPVGARVRVGPARGMFTTDPTDRRRLFVATGTGLAPFLAMLEASFASGDQVATTLIHGASYADELAYAGRLADWVAGGLALDYRPTVSRSGDPRNRDWFGLTGRADAQLERALAQGGPALGATRAYLCGNPAMVDSCRRQLMGAGFSAAEIRTELFHAPGH